MNWVQIINSNNKISPKAKNRDEELEDMKNLYN